MLKRIWNELTEIMLLMSMIAGLSIFSVVIAGSILMAVST